MRTALGSLPARLATHARLGLRLSQHRLLAMGAAAAEADRTLFVGNLDPGVTEELLFELFLQGGPVLNVKIPKDREGKAKSFAFVNFKHEESVPYGMSLLNGIKLFGRPLKIQFRSGSSHASQDNGALYSSQNGGLSVAQHQQQAPATNTNNWYERSTENFSAASSSSSVSRSFSSFPLENLQRQAVLMTGLDIERDHILEMACLVTDADLNLVAEGPNLIIHQPDEVLEGMSEWCKEHHGKSGLTRAVRESAVSLCEAELV
uniref:RRM domain-containing protein n=1 Tax=Anolis carolinensis TaxID=28377 RepID=H9GHW0_ANOCA